MSKLVFHYSAMNAGKTTRLLQVAYSYTSSGKKVACLLPDIQSRFGEAKGVIKSRIGIESPATIVSSETNIFDLDSWIQYDIILVDEAQFLTAKQIKELSDIVDILGVTVLAYGLRIDSNGDLFEGTKNLFEMADVLEEIQGVCCHPECTRRATHVLRTNDNGDVIKNGSQINIGAEEQYHSVCRKHWKLEIFQ